MQFQKTISDVLTSVSLTMLIITHHHQHLHWLETKYAHQLVTQQQPQSYNHWVQVIMAKQLNLNHSYQHTQYQYEMKHPILQPSTAISYNSETALDQFNTSTHTLLNINVTDSQ